MLKQNLGWVIGKTEQMENSHLWFSECRKVTRHKCQSINVNGNRISVSAIMKKLKHGCHFININCTEKFQITDPPKNWVSSFPSVNGNGISVLAIMKKLKNGYHFINIDHMEKFQINDPPKFGSPVFQVSMETEYQCQPI